MTLNVLLMLASSEPPPPCEEVKWHDDCCRKIGKTYIALSKVLTGLTSGESIVAFFGDNSESNTLFATSVFLSYVRLGTPQAQELLKGDSIYAARGQPKNAKGFVEVRDFRRAEPGTPIDSLRGIIASRGKSNGLALTCDNLPKGQARGQIYYLLARNQPTKGASQPP